MSIQKMYNPLTKLVRRINEMLHTKRDIILMTLVLFVSLLIMVGIDLTNNYPKQTTTIVILFSAAIILLLLIGYMVRNIMKIDNIEDNENLDDKAKLDSIVDKLEITKEDISKHRKTNQHKNAQSISHKEDSQN